MQLENWDLLLDEASGSKILNRGTISGDILRRGYCQAIVVSEKRYVRDSPRPRILINWNDLVFIMHLVEKQYYLEIGIDMHAFYCSIYRPDIFCISWI